MINWALRVGPDSDDSITDLKMGHTTIRRMLGELGTRLVVLGVIQNKEDVYWLEEGEVNTIAPHLEKGECCPSIPDWLLNAKPSGMNG